MSNPKISIITVVFNGQEFIAQAIESVLSQNYSNTEYIVIDGASSDSTVEEIQQYINDIDVFISEKDTGIADAMNKAVALSSGDYVCFLHADDYFKSEDSLSIAVNLLESDTDVFAACIEFGSRETSFSVLKPRGFTWWLNIKNGIHHQATLCKRTLFDKLLGFDEEYRVAMDYDFFLRAYREGGNCKTSSLVMTVMRNGGVSSRLDASSLKARLGEEKRIHLSNNKSLFWKLLYKSWWSVYPRYKLKTSSKVDL